MQKFLPSEKKIIEALLFASPEPLTQTKVNGVFGGNQFVSYDMTTPDPQFNYTGVRVFNNGANRIASFDQPMFVGNTYVFSFFVKCYGERTIFPRISYNGYDGIGAGEILYTNEDGNWEEAISVPCK